MKKKNLFEKLYEEFKNDLECKYEHKLTEITEEICRVMNEKGISNHLLSLLLGMSKCEIIDMLNGNSKLELKLLVKIAHVLDCDFSFKLKEK